MLAQEEITDLVAALNEEGGTPLRLRDSEREELKALLARHPGLWPVGLAETFRLLRCRLAWESIDRSAIPEVLLPFFDAKVLRDMDTLAMAREIGRDICGACESCGCRC